MLKWQLHPNQHLVLTTHEAHEVHSEGAVWTRRFPSYLFRTLGLEPIVILSLENVGVP